MSGNPAMDDAYWHPNPYDPQPVECGGCGWLFAEEWLRDIGDEHKLLCPDCERDYWIDHPNEADVDDRPASGSWS